MKSNTSRIPYVNLKKQWLEERSELLPIIDQVLHGIQVLALSFLVVEIIQKLGGDVEHIVEKPR